jgi:glyoxylase-like metal-dependent hydrolase (beta-lactamase superfamily II)
MEIWKLPLWLAETNAYVVAGDGPGGECVLIDAPPAPAPILGLLAEHGLRLVALLCTHGHLDHVGGVTSVITGAAADGGSPAPTHIHDDDRHMLLDPLGTGGDFGRYLAMEQLDLSPPEVVTGLGDGQVVRGGSLAFTAVHTPGHTRGSVCFRLDVEGEPPLLFSGDHLFAGSIGRTDLPGGSYDGLAASMRDKILPMDDDVVVLPGHGGNTTIGQERRTNPFVLQMLAE